MLSRLNILILSNTRLLFHTCHFHMFKFICLLFSVGFSNHFISGHIKQFLLYLPPTPMCWPGWKLFLLALDILGVNLALRHCLELEEKSKIKYLLQIKIFIHSTSLTWHHQKKKCKCYLQFTAYCLLSNPSCTILFLFCIALAL